MNNKYLVFYVRKVCIIMEINSLTTKEYDLYKLKSDCYQIWKKMVLITFSYLIMGIKCGWR